MRTLKTLSFIVLTFASVFYFGAEQVSAVGLSVQPVKASYTMEPGETITDTILLKNTSTEDVNVDMKIEDFIPVAGASGIQFVGRAEGVTTVRDWITIEDGQSFVFEEGEKRRIKYTITAPENAEPGSHFGVAFFKASKLDREDGKEQLKIGTQLGVLIFVTIPGEHLQKGEILDFTSHKFITSVPVRFNIKFENTGTVHFEPKGNIRITNIFGKEVGNVPVSGQPVLPTGTRDLTADWHVGNNLIGMYTAELEIVDGEGNELTAESIRFYAFPVWHFLAFVATVMVLFFGIKFLKSKLNISISVNGGEKKEKKKKEKRKKEKYVAPVVSEESESDEEFDDTPSYYDEEEEDEGVKIEIVKAKKKPKKVTKKQSKTKSSATKKKKTASSVKKKTTSSSKSKTKTKNKTSKSTKKGIKKKK